MGSRTTPGEAGRRGVDEVSERERIRRGKEGETGRREKGGGGFG